MIAILKDWSTRIFPQLALLLSCIVFSAALFTLHANEIDFSSATFTLPGHAAARFAPPLRIRQKWTSVAVQSTFALSQFSSTLIDIRSDNCIDGISINASPIDVPRDAICKSRSYTLDIGRWVHPGANTLALQIRNTGGYGGVEVVTSRVSAAGIALRSCMLAAVVLFSVFFLRLCGLRIGAPIAVAAFGGLALRLIYFGATPYWVRAHDVWGHIDYMRHVAAKLSIPNARQGWEMFQPPLYYFVCAVWVKIAPLFGRALILVCNDLSILSLCCSLAVLGAIFAIGAMLFGTHEKRGMFLYCAFVATLPAMIFFATPLTNDVLFDVVNFISFAVLLRWWQTGIPRLWYAAIFLLALGYLTKSSALLMVMLAYGLLLADRRVPFKARARLGLVGGIVLLVLCAWLPALRIVRDGENAMVGNITRLSARLQVADSLDSFTTFRPLEVLRQPYNDPWRDESGRKYFWEFFYRSFFSGEYDFGPELTRLARCIVLLGFPFALFVLLGLWRELKINGTKNLPVFALLIVMLGALIAYRYHYPFSANQDFRFVHPLLIPLAYYSARFIGDAPKAVSHVASAIMVALCIFSACFVVGIYFTSTRFGI